MKKIILPILLGVCSLYAEKNVVFADASFKRAVLNSKINTNEDAEISEEEALVADSISIQIVNPNDAIVSYKDLSLFPNLIYLSIYESYDSAFPKAIDFSGLPSLEKLKVHSYKKDITCNNLSTLAALQSLELSVGSSNIDLHNLTKLSDLILDSFGSELKLPPNLKRLIIDNSSLTELDLSNCMLPNSFVSVTYCTQLSTLVLPVSKLKKLELHYLYALKSLDLSQGMVPDNKVSISMSGLESLTLPAAGGLDTLILDNVTLEMIDLSAQNRLKQLKISNIQSLDGIKFPKLNILNTLEFKYNTFDGNLDFKDLNSLERLSVAGKLIDSLFLPTNSHLQYLDIPSVYSPYSPVGYIVNLENQIYLRGLNLNGNITNSTIDISKMTQLKQLSYNGIYSEDHVRFVCIKDTNQLKHIDLIDTDPYVHFVTCHDVDSKTACKDHVTHTSICDDFKDASPGDDSNDEYAIVTDKPAWLYDMPSPYAKAYMGAFWVLPAQSSDFISSKTRNDDGSLTFNISSSSTLSQPMMLSFGNYADGNREGKFTLDLSDNAVVSFEVEDFKSLSSNLIVELEDIHGNSLRLDKSVLQNENDEFYGHYQIGIPIQLLDFYDNKVNGIQLGKIIGYNYEAKAKYLPDFAPNSNKVHKFYYDFKNAICGQFEKILPEGCCKDSIFSVVPKRELNFDYKQVALLKLMRIPYGQENLVGNKNDYSFTISNFKMGAVDYTVGIEQEISQNFDHEIFKVYDMQGSFVAEGAWQQLVLNPKQLYILKSNQRTFKLLVRE